jgi:diphthine synthase
VVLLVPGDPLVATTHVHLIMEAKEMGIGFEVVHSSSVYTAVARTGLQIYKFGRTATIITPRKGYGSEGFYKAIEENQKQGLHTLLLLDVGMGTKRALEILKGIDKKRKSGLLDRVVLCSRLGSESESIVYGEPDELMRKDLPCPAVVIVPGSLHFMEKEFLNGL